MQRGNIVNDGFMWFKSSDGVGGERSVGLSMKIVERMKWEQERVGWVSGDEQQVRDERVDEFGGTGEWKKFACYVLVGQQFWHMISSTLTKLGANGNEKLRDFYTKLG
ncbi:hypothetical protein ACLB2K_042788 [Fragaria x ananassa]